MLTTNQILLLGILWVGVFCNYVCYSIIAPFFPQLAREKGLSAEKYSLVFGAYSLSQLVFSLMTGKFLNKIGAKCIAIVGLFITGAATVFFGMLEMVPGPRPFFITCIAIRMIEGAGFAAYFTSVLSLVVKTFPDDPGYYVGLTEVIVTIGMIGGPPAGSFLYTIGGYRTPFVTFGMIIVLTSLLAICTVEDSTESETSKYDLELYGGCPKKASTLTLGEYFAVLRLPAAFLTVLCVTFNVVADAFILITLSGHLQQFNISTMQVGGVYLCLFLSYGLSSPLAGWIADKTALEFLLQGIGCLILAGSFVLIGPASFLAMKPSIPLIITGLLLKGVGAGPLISCSYSACLRSAKEDAGFPNDFRTYSLVSSVVSFSIPLGNLIGGATAGIMYDRLGMHLATTIHTGNFVCLGFVCFIIFLIDRSKVRPPRKGNEGEYEPLYDCEIKMDSLPVQNGFLSTMKEEPAEA